MVRLWRAPEGDKPVFVLYLISILNRDYREWSFAHVSTVEELFFFFNRVKRMFPRYLTTSWEDKLAHAALLWNTLVPIHISYSCFWKGGCFNLSLISVKERCLEHTGIAAHLFSHFLTYFLTRIFRFCSRFLVLFLSYLLTFCFNVYFLMTGLFHSAIKTSCWNNYVQLVFDCLPCDVCFSSCPKLALLTTAEFHLDRLALQEGIILVSVNNWSHMLDHRGVEHKEAKMHKTNSCICGAGFSNACSHMRMSTLN